MPPGRPADCHRRAPGTGERLIYRFCHDKRAGTREPTNAPSDPAICLGARLRTPADGDTPRPQAPITWSDELTNGSRSRRRRYLKSALADLSVPVANFQCPVMHDMRPTSSARSGSGSAAHHVIHGHALLAVDGRTFPGHSACRQPSRQACTSDLPAPQITQQRARGIGPPPAPRPRCVSTWLSARTI